MILPLRRLTPQRAETLRSYVQNGLSARRADAELVSDHTIRAALKKAGVRIRPRPGVEAGRQAQP